MLWKREMGLYNVHAKQVWGNAGISEIWSPAAHSSLIPSDIFQIIPFSILTLRQSKTTVIDCRNFHANTRYFWWNSCYSSCCSWVLFPFTNIPSVTYLHYSQFVLQKKRKNMTIWIGFQHSQEAVYNSRTPCELVKFVLQVLFQCRLYWKMVAQGNKIISTIWASLNLRTYPNFASSVT